MCLFVVNQEPTDDKENDPDYDPQECDLKTGNNVSTLGEENFFNDGEFSGQLTPRFSAPIINEIVHLVLLVLH